MLSHERLLSLSLSLFAGLLVVQAQPLPAIPHHFESIRALPDRTISLSLAGRPTNAFRSYYDIYPIEVSSDLLNWQPLITLVRTNASTNALTHLDLEANDQAQRFYRTPTNHFITLFPKPTGPYPVGTFSTFFNDPTRTNRFGIRTNGTFAVTFWYPAEKVTGTGPSVVFDPKLADQVSGLFGGSPNIYRVAVSFASTNLPAISSTSGPFPILFYSHGFSGVRQENVDKCEELASYGYIVVAADHYDCGATVLLNGRLYSGGSSSGGANQKVKDFLFILNRLAELNESDGVLKSKMILDRIGVFGWSLGGAAAGEFCRTDERVKAAAMLDGSYGDTPNLTKFGLHKPFISMNASLDSRISGNVQLFNSATNVSYFLRLRSTDHFTFAMYALAEPSPSFRNAALAMRACLVSFFNKHLKGEDDHLLDDPTKVHGSIYDFRKK